MTHNINNEHSVINTNKIRNLLTKLTRDQGINKWDLGASSSNDISVQIDKGEPKQLKASQRSSITIRIWDHINRVGITSTSDLTDTGLEKAIRGAKEASEFGNIYETPEFSPLAKQNIKMKELVSPKRYGIKSLLNILRDSEDSLLSSHNSIDSVPYNGLSESFYERIYLNSDGAKRNMNTSQACIYLYSKAEETGRKPRSSGSVKIAYSIDELKIKECIEEAAQKTISHLNYQPIITGKYLICFKPEAFLELINAFSNIFNARSILDGVSLSQKDSLGCKLAVPELSIVDNGLHPTNIGSFSFDGEGTPTKELEIIKRGVLKNLIHSEYTARKFGVNPSGHAGLGSKASVSPDWLIIGNDKEITSVNKDLNHNSTSGKYIMIESLNALHSGVKASQGSFSLPFDGWLVENGYKTSIEAATVAGDIKELLLNIIQVEDKQFETHIGISPHVWINNLSITGEA